jgi:7,8-dihydroneopterin aldolase/epimerase/oxygenase
MSRISIVDLEVFYSVGVTEEERAKPQRLLISVDLSYDFSAAAVSDRIEKTINYQKLAEEILKFGEHRSWKLLEKLVVNMAEMIWAHYRPNAVLVEVKKFAIPQARYVSVSYTKSRPR